MKLSIITINFNNKNGLQRTIESVLSQTFRDFEWIIIDGGSTDGSKKLIEDVAADNESNIVFWCSEPDNGIYHAMNKGIDHANGEYLNFMNSGDTFYESTTLQKVFSKEYSSDILFGNWCKVYSDHTKIESYPTTPKLWDIYTITICQQAMFVRSSILKKCGFNESFHIQGDRHRWVQAAWEGNSFEHIGLTVCNFYMDGISVSEQKYPEENKMVDAVLPQNVVPMLKLLYYYENYHPFVRLKNIITKGGLLKSITNAYLKIVDKLC